MRKTYKVLNVILLALFYALASLMLFACILTKLGTSLEIVETFKIVHLVLAICIWILLFPCTVFFMVYAAVGKESLTSDILRYKLIYIPCFLINFFNFFIIVSGYSGFDYGFDKVLFTMVYVMTTYSFLLVTSIPLAVSFIKLYITRKIKVSAGGIIWILLSFIFCIDVLSAIFLFKTEKKYMPEAVRARELTILEQSKEWPNKKGMSFTSFKIVSVLASSLMYAVMIMLVITSIGAIPQSNDPSIFIAEFIKNPFLVPTFVVIAVAGLTKLIIGLVYGRKGKEDPTKFCLIMKYVDLPIVLILFAIMFVMYITSSLMFILACALFIFIVVIIIALAVISFFIFGSLAFAVGTGSVLEAVTLIYSNNMTVVSYALNQRKMNNKKFKSKWTVIFLVLLFIPVLDFVAMHLIKNIIRDNKLLGETPVIKE